MGVESGVETVGRITPHGYLGVLYSLPAFLSDRESALIFPDPDKSPQSPTSAFYSLPSWGGKGIILPLLSCFTYANLLVMRIGEIIRKWRLMNELDLRTVSKDIGIGAATLMRLEQGHVPDGNTLARVFTWLTEKVK